MSSTCFKTIYRNAVAEIVIEKSRFISSIVKVNTEEDVFEFFALIRKKYFDATHNCTAFILKSGTMRSSDDGEPSGTAGRPMLEYLKKNEVYNVAVVVTRFFGGIKLGTGGLVRAYSAAVNDVLKKAGTVEYTLHKSYILALEYTNWKRVENHLNSNLICFEKPEFLQDIQVKVYVKNENTFFQEINDLCNGLVLIERSEDKFIEILLSKPSE
ncbi:YigZ family protein [Fluviispira multicolorata]|nr:YigZ family protein [Fluviispira multicolorata]